MQADVITNRAPTTPVEDRSAYIGYAIVGIVLAALYYSTFKWMVEAWSVTDSNYSHGPLVVAVIVWFLWEKRPHMTAAPKRMDIRGLWVIAAGLLVHLAGLLLDVHFMSGLSLFGIAWGLALYYFGPWVLKETLWPFVFMIFMIPLPYIQAGLTIKLQVLSSIAAEHVFNALGLDVVREGTMLMLPSFHLFVEAPCSGLNTLFSLIFVGSVVAYLAKGTLTRKTILLLSAVPIAVLANILRIVLIGLIGEYHGPELAMGVFHKGSGLIMYGVGLTLFLLEAWALRVKFSS